MIIRCLQLSFVLSLAGRVIVSAQNITTGFQGRAVVLPCSTPIDETQLKIYWSYTGKIVHDFVHGKDDLSDQDIQFKNRTRLFPSEFKKGNFSLKLINLNKSDNGVYICRVNLKQINTIQLRVEESTKDRALGSSTRMSAEVIYYFLVLTLLYMHL